MRCAMYNLISPVKAKFCHDPNMQCPASEETDFDKLRLHDELSSLQGKYETLLERFKEMKPGLPVDEHLQSNTKKVYEVLTGMSINPAVNAEGADSTNPTYVVTSSTVPNFAFNLVVTKERIVYTPVNMPLDLTEDYEFLMAEYFFLYFQSNIISIE